MPKLNMTTGQVAKPKRPQYVYLEGNKSEYSPGQLRVTPIIPLDFNPRIFQTIMNQLVNDHMKADPDLSRRVMELDDLRAYPSRDMFYRVGLTNVVESFGYGDEAADQASRVLAIVLYKLLMAQRDIMYAAGFFRILQNCPGHGAGACAIGSANYNKISTALIDLTGLPVSSQLQEMIKQHLKPTAGQMLGMDSMNINYLRLFMPSYGVYKTSDGVTYHDLTVPDLQNTDGGNTASINTLLLDMRDINNYINNQSTPKYVIRPSVPGSAASHAFGMIIGPHDHTVRIEKFITAPMDQPLRMKAQYINMTLTLLEDACYRYKKILGLGDKGKAANAGNPYFKLKNSNLLLDIAKKFGFMDSVFDADTFSVEMASGLLKPGDDDLFVKDRTSHKPKTFRRYEKKNWVDADTMEVNASLCGTPDFKERSTPVDAFEAWVALLEIGTGTPRTITYCDHINNSVNAIRFRTLPQAMLNYYRGVTISVLERQRQTVVEGQINLSTPRRSIDVRAYSKRVNYDSYPEPIRHTLLSDELEADFAFNVEEYEVFESSFQLDALAGDIKMKPGMLPTDVICDSERIDDEGVIGGSLLPFVRTTKYLGKADYFGEGSLHSFKPMLDKHLSGRELRSLMASMDNMVLYGDIADFTQMEYNQSVSIDPTLFIGLTSQSAGSSRKIWANEKMIPLLPERYVEFNDDYDDIIMLLDYNLDSGATGNSVNNPETKFVNRKPTMMLVPNATFNTYMNVKYESASAPVGYMHPTVIEHIDECLISSNDYKSVMASINNYPRTQLIIPPTLLHPFVRDGLAFVVTEPNGPDPFTMTNPDYHVQVTGTEGYLLLSSDMDVVTNWTTWLSTVTGVPYVMEDAGFLFIGGELLRNIRFFSFLLGDYLPIGKRTFWEASRGSDALNGRVKWSYYPAELSMIVGTLTENRAYFRAPTAVCELDVSLQALYNFWNPLIYQDDAKYLGVSRILALEEAFSAERSIQRSEVVKLVFDKASDKGQSKVVGKFHFIGAELSRNVKRLERNPLDRVNTNKFSKNKDEGGEKFSMKFKKEVLKDDVPKKIVTDTSSKIDESVNSIDQTQNNKFDGSSS